MENPISTGTAVPINISIQIAQPQSQSDVQLRGKVEIRFLLGRAMITGRILYVEEIKIGIFQIIFC